MVNGTLEYTDQYGEVTMVGERRCLSEAALWTTWKHRGTLTLGVAAMQVIAASFGPPRSSSSLIRKTKDGGHTHRSHVWYNYLPTFGLFLW